MIIKTNQVKNTTTSGRFGEEIALHYLEQKAYRLIAKNYHIREGELDLIMQKNDIITFVEVKFRTSQDFGNGGEAITGSKKQKLLHAIFSFLQTLPHHKSWQLDLIDIHFDKKSNTAYVQHIPNILDA